MLAVLFFLALPAWAQNRAGIESEPLDSPSGVPATPKAAPAKSPPPSEPAYAPAPVAAPAESNGQSDEQDLINRADVTLKFMRGNKDFKEVDQYLARARAVFIVPQLIKAAFFIGGEGGDGVMIARQPDGTWSGPSFAVIGSASIGLQAGAKSSEIIFLIMTDKGLNAILNRDVKLGADVSVALITVGKGLGAGTGIDTDADIYAVAKSDGLFGGAAFDGSIINPLDGDNEAFYGQKIEARDILNGRTPPPTGAQALVEDLR